MRTKELPSPGTDVLITVTQKISAYCARCWINAGLQESVRSDATNDVIVILYSSHILPAYADCLLEPSDDHQSPWRHFTRAIGTVRKRYQRGLAHDAQHTVPVVHDLPGNASPEEDAGYRELCSKIMDAIRQMPPHYADAIRSLLWGEPPQEQLAKQLGRGISDVLYKAKRQLRKLLIPKDGTQLQPMPT